MEAVKINPILKYEWECKDCNKINIESIWPQDNDVVLCEYCEAVYKINKVRLNNGNSKN